MSNWNNAPNTLNGWGFTVDIPPGFSAMPTDPVSGGFIAWPAGSTPPPNSPALVWLVPVDQFRFPMLQQQYFNFDNPMVATANAQTLGLLSVLNVAPLRQTSLNGAAALIREFDAVSMTGQPVHMSAMLLRGPSSALQCIVGFNLYRWVEFTGPTLQFLARIQLAGTIAATNAQPAELRTIVDRNTFSHAQMQVVNSDLTVAPIITMPTRVEGFQVLQINLNGGNFSLGDVKGTTVQIGDHNTTNSTPSQPTL